MTNLFNKLFKNKKIDEAKSQKKDTIIKEDDPVIRFEHPSDILKHMREFTQQGIRSLDIFSHNLSPILYNDQELMDAIVALIGYSPRTQIRILVRNSKHLHNTDCPLVTLARRVPSKVSIRVYKDGAKNPGMGFFCVDKKHLVYFNNEPTYQGFARKNAKPESKKSLDEFGHLWVYGSEEDENLRQLSL